MAYTTIDKPSEHFNTKLYTGTGATHAITGVGFKPDWVWIKSRSQAVNHYGFDAVRGATKGLSQNINNAESTRDSTWFNSFDSDGFTIGSEANINNSSSTYASWNWKASNATAVSNTDGSITSSVSVNTTAGFSIITYTGTGSAATVGHGLGVAPKVTIFKRRDATNSWRTQTTVIDGSLDNFYLNLSDAKTNASNSAPTSSVLNLDTGTEVNTSSGTYVAYNFAEIKGYSKFGTYIGQGSANPFIYTGFKPAIIIIKSLNATGWLLVDNRRNGFNPQNRWLYPTVSDVEETLDDRIDILSNGFKALNSWSALNGDGVEYFYMAFAEAPLVGSNNVPCTAR